DILAADLRKTRREFRPYERADQRDDAAERPDKQDEYGIVHDPGNVRWIGEDPDANDAAGDHDDRVEQPELASKPGHPLNADPARRRCDGASAEPCRRRQSSTVTGPGAGADVMWSPEIGRCRLRGMR